MRRTRDLMILALGWSDNQTRVTLSEILCKGERAVGNHLKELQRNKLVLKNIRSNHYVLTKIGYERFKELKEEISEYELTPERNGTTKVCKLKVIISKIRKPVTLVRLVKAFWNDEHVDILELFQREDAFNESSYFNRWMDEMLLSGGEHTLTEDKAFLDLSLLGIKPGQYNGWIDDVRSALINADLKRRQGNVTDALNDFQKILYRKGLEPGYWIVCLIGLIYCVNLKNGSETALKMIEIELKQSTNNGHKAWLIYLKADILSDMGEYEKAKQFYDHSLRIMAILKMGVSMAEVRNSYGVNLFRQGNEEGAERQWIRCRDLSIKHKLPRMKSLAEINLADVYSKRGNIRRANDNLNRAYKVLKKVGDLEGISGVNFNRALVFLRAGKHDKALKAFRESEEYPLIYKQKRDERRRVFEQCWNETGHPLSRNPI